MRLIMEENLTGLDRKKSLKSDAPPEKGKVLTDLVRGFTSLTTLINPQVCLRQCQAPIKGNGRMQWMQSISH